MSFPKARLTIRELAADDHVAFGAPCGLWQSEHLIAPSLTRCLKGSSKRAPYLEMAGVADLALLLGEQRADLGGAVDRVAGDAAHFAGRVRRAPNLDLAEIIGVTREAAVEHRARLELGETDDLSFVPRAAHVQGRRARGSPRNR